jgi:hypothetical protein
VADASHITCGGWRLMGKRWIFAVILVVLVAGGIAGWIRADSTRSVKAPPPATSGANAAACVLSEPPDTSIDRDNLEGVAAVGDSVVGAGTRFLGSNAIGLTAGESSRGWKAEPVEMFQHLRSLLYDVSGDRAGGAWVVGIAGGKPAVGRWNGHSWAESPSPDPGPSLDLLSGVAAESPRLAWAVGRLNDGVAYRTLIERWDGTTWHVVTTPDIGTEPNILKDVAVAGSDDVWAVGWRLAGRHYRALAEHWDGSRWRIVPTPDLGPGDTILTGVAALSSEDVWSVGWRSDGDVPRPVIEHWDGSRWAIVPPPSDVGSAAFSAVTPMSHGVAIVGRQFVDQRPKALALLHDSAGWHVVKIEVAPSPQAWLNGVAVDASGTLWAVGSRFTSDGLFASLVVSGCAGS